MGPREDGFPVNDLLMGIPEVGEIHPGIHVCALFSGPVERDRLLVSFMQEGLRHGDQCVCLIDELESASIRQRVYPSAGLSDRRQHLDVYSAPDAYLRTREFSPQQSFSPLVANSGSPTDAFPLLRAAGQMSRGSHESGAREVSIYETAVIHILAELPTVFLCLYDVQRFGAGILASVLKIHSMVLLDGTVLHNPHSVAPPDTPEPAADAAVRYPLARKGPGHEAWVDDWQSLSGAEVRVAQLVGTGLSNRATAQQLSVSPHTVDAHLKHIFQKLCIHSRVELAVLSFHHASPSA
ncbi:LuxR family transcriptional regulator [Cryobacterium arcticum]|uniref:LuxR family transcriptional regulator n=1 Tax=Cryobacterium arcticum TaxID=670052 RepID=A0A1B1BI48_9MICO|nr:LuxR family transcriptional regulator [Cryobacterium arcticum]